MSGLKVLLEYEFRKYGTIRPCLVQSGLAKL